MYLKSDCKKIISNKLIITLLIALLLVMIADPISILIQSINQPAVFETLGVNPFQYWILINSASFGGSIFYIGFFIFPVFFSGVIFHSEQSSSISQLLISKKSKTKYFVSKALSFFFFTFIAFSTLLLINVAITYCIFPNTNDFTEQYKFFVPQEGTFAYMLYSINPAFMAVGYSLLNGLALALVSAFYYAVQLIAKFKNQYASLIVPVVLFYVISYVFDTITFLWNYNLKLIIQPISASALTRIISAQDVGITLMIWFIIDIVLISIGIIRNRDVL